MKLWLITESKYPDYSAVSIRIHMLLKAYAESGLHVKVYSRTPKKNGINEGIEYYSVRGHSNNRISLFLNYFFVMPRMIMNAIKKENPEVILVYNAPLHLMRRLIRNQKKYSFILLHDSVEWYSKEEFKHPYLSKQYLERELWMRKLLPGKVKIIAISQFLKQYFTNCGNKCVYVPAVCDTKQIHPNKHIQDKLTIAYAGTPGKKDYFKEIIRALQLLTHEERQKIKLVIIGATDQQLAINAEVPIDEIKDLNGCIGCVGRVSHDEVYNYLSNADFTILIRPEHLRYAQAGFPTKVPESLATGTPVICNITSDLGMYLKDGENALIVQGCDAEAIKATILRALKLSVEEKEKMSHSARSTAEEFFDYRLYKETLMSLLADKP